MSLKDLKIKLPSSWREMSRFGHENQVAIKLYHINPVLKVDPSIFEVPEYSNKPNVTITKIDPPKVNLPFSHFFDALQSAVTFGLLPPEWSAKIDTLRKDASTVNMPEDGDLTINFSVIRYANEEIAKQSFKNTMLMPTKGLNVPIPGGTGIPDAPQDITYSDLFKDGTYEKHLAPHISKEQLETLREMTAKIDREMKEKINPNLEKLAGQYKEGKYLGLDAIYLEIKEKDKLKTKKPNKSKIKGSGGINDRLDPLPKVTKIKKDSIILYQSLLVKNFIITGDILTLSDSFTPGNTPCYSLTNYKKEVTSFKENGQTFTNITFIPLPSTLAKENYLHKEEMEEILKSIISNLKNNL